MEDSIMKANFTVDLTIVFTSSNVSRPLGSGWPVAVTPV